MTELTIDDLLVAAQALSSFSFEKKTNLEERVERPTLRDERPLQPIGVDSVFELPSTFDSSPESTDAYFADFDDDRFTEQLGDTDESTDVIQVLRFARVRSHALRAV